MKYIAVFDVPDGYSIGCAVAKIAPKGLETYTNEDFQDLYADVEPLSEVGTEAFELFKSVERIMWDMGINNAYATPSFWCNKGKDFKVIQTNYNKGYAKALEDVEREVRKKFCFAERDYDAPMYTPFEECRTERKETEDDTTN